MIVLSKNEEDYSDYVQHMSSLVGALSLLAGFTFTAFTILLAQLPNPSSLLSQFTLIFLAALIFLFLNLLEYSHVRIIRYCKNIPPASRGVNTFNSLIILGSLGLGFAILLMLLIWNFIYPALATAVVWGISIILSHIYITKPFAEYRKTTSQSGS